MTTDEWSVRGDGSWVIDHGVIRHVATPCFWFGQIKENSIQKRRHQFSVRTGRHR
jgi:hypothetical protein